MITLKTIILPVDFSTRAASVAAHARILAKQYGATIVALHVMRPFQLAAEGVDVPTAAVVSSRAGDFGKESFDKKWRRRVASSS